MSQGGLSALQARRIVEARLGREPQDMLEAAVVLEAWAGVGADEALAHGREMMAWAPSAPKPSAGACPATPEHARHRDRGARRSSSSSSRSRCWAAPLSDRLGAGVVERALIIALPATLALQWGLASRYLGRPEGLAHLGRRRFLLAPAGGRARRRAGGAVRP